MIAQADDLHFQGFAQSYTLTNGTGFGPPQVKQPRNTGGRMKKTLKMGLIGFVLGAAVAVGAATLGSEETSAAPCCSNCADDDLRCWRICSMSC